MLPARIQRRLDNHQLLVGRVGSLDTLSSCLNTFGVLTSDELPREQRGYGRNLRRPEYMFDIGRGLVQRGGKSGPRS